MAYCSLVGHDVSYIYIFFIWTATKFVILLDLNHEFKMPRNAKCTFSPKNQEFQGHKY